MIVLVILVQSKGEHPTCKHASHCWIVFSMTHLTHIQKFITYLEIFHKVQDELKEEILKRASHKTLNKGEVFIRKGGYDKVMGFLSEGIMRIYDIDQQGQNWNKSILNYQTILLGNAESGQPSIHNIAAISSCHLVILPVSFLQAAMEQFNDLRIIKGGILSKIYQLKSERESDLLLLSTKERYLKLKERLGSDLDLIPQYHIASFLGVTPIQLSRIRSTLSS